MPYVDVWVDGSDFLEEMTDEDLAAEVARRAAKTTPPGTQVVTDEMLLNRIYLHFRERTDAPECLRDYLWNKIGKTF